MIRPTSPRVRLPVAAPTQEVDPLALARDLARSVEGEVRFDTGSRALYATDASNYRHVPIGVVVPRHAEDVVATIAACRRHRAPVLSRGGGTSLAGQCCNVAVVLDFSKSMADILELDPQRRRVQVQPGIVLDRLRERAELHHLTFGPDPATHSRCTLGGMLGNNSCGVHALMAGKTVDNTEALEVLTYDGLRLHVGPTSDAELAQILRAGGRRGEIYGRLLALRDRFADLIRARFPHIPRRVSGYNLDELLPERGFHVARALVGSESTCVTILNATLTLVDSPPHRVLAVLGFPDVYAAADSVPTILAESRPIGLEGLDDRLIDFMRRKRLHVADLRFLPAGGGWLLVEFGGATPAEAEAHARALVARTRGLTTGAAIHASPDVEAALWQIRESGLGATARVPGMPDSAPGWEDAAVAPTELGRYIREFRRLLDEYGYDAALYGHFGQGCLHCRITFDLVTPEGVRRYRRFVTAAAQLVTRHGGSLSGEHGDGQSRAELLPIMFGDELIAAFREFKAIWDPDGRMNPGRIVDPRPLDADLRLHAVAGAQEPALHIRLGDDPTLARAVTRCVGVGLCRKHDAGTMCPSYMATREEMHSTRGRAHLIFEALVGDPLRGAMHDPHVKEALDLCLACKACKSECPVNVDMATYKAEYLAHYYRRHWRPLAAHAFGFIDVLARLAAPIPRLANFLLHAPGLSWLAHRLLGLAPQRSLPSLATRSFRAWTAQRQARPTSGPRVVLWVDTFSEHFHPEVAIAATHALEALGHRVDLSPAGLCCGRPLYDFGFLNVARRRLRRIVDAMRRDIEAGTPVVGLEPSCVSVFRDELPNMLPDDPHAARLARQTLTLAEFVTRAPLPELRPLARKAVVHGHCHQKAVLGQDSDRALCQTLGLDADFLDAGCCGMAGSFGFQRGSYDVSIAAGERALLPAVRAADEETLIIADGFSCRTQIEQRTDRRPLHLAQVLDLALHR